MLGNYSFFFRTIRSSEWAGHEKRLSIGDSHAFIALRAWVILSHGVIAIIFIQRRLSPIFLGLVVFPLLAVLD
jgi:hypothetical protein